MYFSYELGITYRGVSDSSTPSRVGLLRRMASTLLEDEQHDAVA